MAKRRSSPRRLLVHIDSSARRQPAFVRALALAAHTRAAIRVVDVAPSPALLRGAPARFLAVVRERMRDRLAEAVAEARRRDVRVTSALLEGDEATALIQAAVAWRADILLRSHAVRTTAAHPPGPVDGQLLRRCPCPVWLVTPKAAGGERTIVAAVDPDPLDPPRHSLAQAVLKTAAAIAEQSGATLHVVCAWSAFAHQLLASHASRAEAREYRDVCRNEAEQRLHALMSEAPTGTVVHLLEGQPDKVIADVIAEQHATLVALGTVGRTGLAGLIMGNTAERVLREVRCAVLALKPEGFAVESPEGGQKAIQLVTK